MKLTLEIWRQAGPTQEGKFETIQVADAAEQMSILELLDHVNDGLIEAGNEPFAFASDCREGICGTCGLLVNGRPHGPGQNTPACQQRLFQFKDGDTIKLEPFRSAAYPVIKDMIVDRSKLDHVMEQGGYVSMDAGTAPDADTLHLNHETAEYSSTTLPASAAVPVWHPARTVQHTCSRVPSWFTSPSCRWARKSVAAAPATWSTTLSRTSVTAPLR